MSRRAGTGQGLVTHNPALTNPLRIGYSILTRKGAIWMYEVIGTARDGFRVAHRRPERGIVAMTIEIHEQTLWLIPVGLAVTFMIWVFLNWWQEERHPNDGRNYSSGAETFQYRSSGRAQERQSDTPFIRETRPKFTPSPQRGQMMRSPE